MLLKNIKTKVEFGITAPEAKQVFLAGDFSDWQQKPIELKRQKNGRWKTYVPLDPGTYQYRFLVDGQWVNDPECTNLTTNPFGDSNCVRVVS